MKKAIKHPYHPHNQLILTGCTNFSSNNCNHTLPKFQINILHRFGGILSNFPWQNCFNSDNAASIQMSQINRLGMLRLKDIPEEIRGKKVVEIYQSGKGYKIFLALALHQTTARANNSKLRTLSRSGQQDSPGVANRTPQE